MAMASRDHRRFRLFGTLRACLLGSAPSTTKAARGAPHHGATALPCSSVSSEVEEPELRLSNLSGDLIDHKAPLSPPDELVLAGDAMDLATALPGDMGLLNAVLSTQRLHSDHAAIFDTLDTMKSLFATHQLEGIVQFAARGGEPSGIVSGESAHGIKPTSPPAPPTCPGAGGCAAVPPSRALRAAPEVDPDFLHLPEAFPTMIGFPEATENVPVQTAPADSVSPQQPRRPDTTATDKGAAGVKGALNAHRGEGGACVQPSGGIDELAPSHIYADGGSVELLLDDVLMFGEGILMGKYRLEPERRAGRHHVVHLATVAQGAAAERGGCDALKFYKNARHFGHEVQLYGDPRFRPALAPVVEVIGNEDGRIRDPFGRSMPPFVVTEYGVRLDEWARSQAPRKVASALVQVAGAIEKLHAAGLVHGALRPSCILWLPQSRAWVVTDYSAACPAGQRVCMAISSPCIVYDPPELVRGRLDKRYHYTVRRVIDAWAFGIIVFELLTGGQVFTQDKANNMRVIRAMTGRGKLPWEAEAGDCSAARERLAQLGFMRDGVLGLLARDPKRRSSLQSVRESWRRTMLLDRAAAPGPVMRRA